LAVNKYHEQILRILEKVNNQKYVHLLLDIPVHYETKNLSSYMYINIHVHTHASSTQFNRSGSLEQDVCRTGNERAAKYIYRTGRPNVLLRH